MEEAAIIKDKSDVIALNLVTYQFQKRPNEWGQYGKNGIDASVRDAKYLLDYLYEAIVANEPQILISYVRWADELFKGLNLPENTMLETLECLKEIVNQEYSVQQQKIFPFLKQAIDALKNKPTTISEPDFFQSPYGIQAQQYIEMLLNGNRHEALQLISRLSDQGVSVKDIYLEIFQPAQYQIGQLWLKNEISVAKEHYCTAVTQQAMSTLYPKIFTTDRKGLTFVAACVGNELHEIGVRMVADFFEMDGWDTYYLGANTPVDGIIKTANERQADLVGLSIALPIHRSLLRSVIEQLKPKLPPKTKIIIGGYALNQTKVDVNWFGAHAYAPNAQEAIEIGNSLAA